MSETHLYRRLQDIAVHKMSLRHGKKTHCFSALFYLIFLRKKSAVFGVKNFIIFICFFTRIFSPFLCALSANFFTHFFAAKKNLPESGLSPAEYKIN